MSEYEETDSLTAEFELYVDDELVATASGPHDKALSEILHYHQVYGQDGGTLEIWQVERTKRSISDIFRYSLSVAKDAVKEAMETRDLP